MGLSAHNNKPLFTINEVAAYLDVLERFVAEQFIYFFFLMLGYMCIVGLVFIVY